MEELSIADKMFEELGYHKDSMSKDSIWYYQYNGAAEQYGFKFDLHDKDIYPVCYGEKEHLAIFFSMAELKAINEKCKELRMVGLGYI